MRRAKEEWTFEAEGSDVFVEKFALLIAVVSLCLLYTSDAADE